jgi:GntR family transcriptional repressor for pyruvate dehydrogenase complex
MRGTAKVGRRLAGSLVDRLVQDITAGGLKPGDRLPPEPELAARFGVSRPTLRQALKSLEAAGLLTSCPRRGTVLAASSPGALGPLLGAHLALADISLAEVAEARAAIEEALAGLAAERRTEGDLAAMRQAIRNEEEARGDLAACVAAERRFHGAIVDAAHNPVLSAFRDLVLSYFNRVRPASAPGTVEAAAERTLRGHREICEAIGERSAEQSAAAMRRHLAPTLAAGVSGESGEGR